MSGQDPRDAGPPPDESQASAVTAPPSQRRRNPWVWVSVVLAIVAIALLVWGLGKQSDLDDANKQIKDLESQVSKGKVTGGAAAVSFKAAYDDLEQQLGITNADLATAQQDLQTVQDEAAKAQQEAAAAQEKAAKSNNATDKANAEAEQAKAEAKAAESQAAIVTDCAKAYVIALGSVVQSENPEDQASAAQQELQGISDTCKKALQGT